MTALDLVITCALVYLAGFTLWAVTHDQLALAACGVVGIIGWSWIPQLIVGRDPDREDK